jgi:hypothetical protein
MKASVFNVGRSLADISPSLSFVRLSIRPAHQAHSSREADRQSPGADVAQSLASEFAQYTETLQIANACRRAASRIIHGSSVKGRQKAAGIAKKSSSSVV